MFSSLAPAFPLQFPSCVMFTSSPGLRDLHILPSQQHSTQARRVASTAQTTMVRFSEGTFSNGRSQHLHTTEYFPDQLPMPRAVVFWHHGYGEHSGRYAAGIPRWVLTLCHYTIRYATLNLHMMFTVAARLHVQQHGNHAHACMRHARMQCTGSWRRRASLCTPTTTTATAGRSQRSAESGHSYTASTTWCACSSPTPCAWYGGWTERLKGASEHAACSGTFHRAGLTPSMHHAPRVHPPRSASAPLTAVACNQCRAGCMVPEFPATTRQGVNITVHKV